MDSAGYTAAMIGMKVREIIKGHISTGNELVDYIIAGMIFNMVQQLSGYSWVVVWPLVWIWKCLQRVYYHVRVNYLMPRTVVLVMDIPDRLDGSPNRTIYQIMREMTSILIGEQKSNVQLGGVRSIAFQGEHNGRLRFYPSNSENALQYTYEGVTYKISVETDEYKETRYQEREVTNTVRMVRLRCVAPWGADPELLNKFVVWLQVQYEAINKTPKAYQWDQANKSWNPIQNHLLTIGFATADSPGLVMPSIEISERIQKRVGEFLKCVRAEKIKPEAQRRATESVKYLLMGYPGTGKTSTWAAIQEITCMPVYIMRLTGVDCATFNVMTSKIPSESIIVIDELDEQFPVLCVSGAESITTAVRPQGLQLDGSKNHLQSPPLDKHSVNAWLDSVCNCIVVATTNNSKKICPVVARRFPNHIEFPYATKYQVSELYRYAFNQSIPADLLTKIMAIDQLSPCYVREVFTRCSIEGIDPYDMSESDYNPRLLAKNYLEEKKDAPDGVAADASPVPCVPTCVPCTPGVVEVIHAIPKGGIVPLDE